MSDERRAIGKVVQLTDVVATSAAVAATSSRTAKVNALAALLQRTPPDEVALVVGYLVGAPPQGRIGVGWAALKPTASLDPASAPELAVRDVNTALDAIQRETGHGSVALRRAAIEGLFARATAEEGDFLRRLLLGELRQGALEGIMTDAVARAAGVPAATMRRAAMLSGDLCAAAAVALSGEGGALEGIGLQVLRPVLPMLAATSTSVTEALETNGRSSVEWKLDGIRVLAHRAGADVRLFSRNNNDITDQLPKVADVLRSLPVDAAILDGEVIGGDVRFFDVLHADGSDLIDEPLEARIDVLAKVAGPYRMPGIVTADADEAEAFAAESVALGHEGVMVKALGSTYEAGRRGRAWRKVKPVKTLDLVVLAAEWGHGRRRGWLSNLHLGTRELTMVGKTFKGMTDALLAWQTEQLLARETGREGITVHVRPELVAEIAVDGVQSSTRYGGGVVLRFARVKRYRDDKAPGDADTIDAVRALLQP